MSFVEPHFQSIVVEADRSVYAVEALCRLKDAHSLPISLIRMWERTGFMANIDLAMLRSVRKLLASNAMPIPFRLAVNVSARTIEIAGEPCMSALEQLASLSRRLIVEITETYCPADWRVVTDFALRAKNAGMYIALDDCSPSNIFWERDFVKVMAPRLLKLDGELLAECIELNDPGPILRLIELAQRIGAHVVAEWIDTDQKRKYAANLGIRLMQGWLFDKAAPYTGRRWSEPNFVAQA